MRVSRLLGNIEDTNVQFPKSEKSMRNLQWNLAVEKGERNHRVISKVRETKSAVETGVSSLLARL